MRWADLDSLNHVNNVVYLAYAANARAVIDELPEGPIGTMSVEFARPLLLGRKPVVVTTTVKGDEVQQAIGLDGTDTTFATVQSRFGGFAPAPPVREDVHVAPLALRHTDLGSGGTVTNVHAFELFQESRVPYISTVLDNLEPGKFVVASVTVDFHRDIAWHPEPLQARSWIARVGNASYTIQAQLTDGEGVLASSTAVLVGFDLAKQSSRRFSDRERELLAAELSPAS